MYFINDEYVGTYSNIDNSDVAIAEMHGGGTPRGIRVPISRFISIGSVLQGWCCLRERSMSSKNAIWRRKGKRSYNFRLPVTNWHRFCWACLWIILTMWRPHTIDHVPYCLPAG